MSRFSPLSLLVQLMLKNHHELREALSATQGAADPLQMGFKVGGTTTTMSLAADQDSGLQMSFTQNGNTYRLSLPRRADSRESATVTVTLESATGTKQEHVFEGSQLFHTDFQGPFADLHEKVLSYLKKTLSKERLNELQRPGAARAATPTSSTNPSEASNPVPGSSAADGVPVATPQAPQAAETSPYKWYRLQRLDMPDLRFSGALKACAESPIRHGRQHIYSVFQTPSGKWVAVKQGLSMWLNERDIADVQVFEQVEQCVAFFGYNWLAKSVYSQLGLGAAVEEVIE